MRTLPKVVANTKVGKSVQLKIWRNKKSISKRLILGRLESSEEFKEKKTLAPKKDDELQVDTLKITVRELNAKDIKSRNLLKKTKGAVILEIDKKSPLVGLLNINDIIIEVQKKSIMNSANIDKMIKNLTQQGSKTVLLTIINSRNQRRYLGVKLN